MGALTTAKTRIGVGGPNKNYALPIAAKSPAAVVTGTKVWRKGPVSPNATMIKV